MSSLTMNSSKSTSNSSSSNLRGFTRIPSVAFQILQDPPFKTYVLHEGGTKPVLFGANDYAGGLSSKDVLSRWENASFYVRTNDASIFRTEIEKGLDQTLANEEMPVEDRYSVLRVIAAGRIEHSFRLLNSDVAVSTVQGIGSQISRLLGGSGMLPDSMFSMAQHDYYTFTHLTNVASYAVVLAELLGISNPQELKEIAVGGMLHDIGKRLISKSILNKKGRLDDEELVAIRAHPQKGYEELCERPDLSHGQLMMVYQHHEWVNGEGYPVRILDEEIHPWAKICAVVDVFDALTCRRSYREAQSREQAVELLQQMAGTQLDKEMVECWTKTQTAQ